ncbi:MAG: hypothetical protein CM15mP59_1730 [Flavobacteriaceae bacterium]|nr:MAG: hypothetical protein CM15mP59_1730 [Flavobacteriaceae bacterium]
MKDLRIRKTTAEAESYVNKFRYTSRTNRRHRPLDP